MDTVKQLIRTKPRVLVYASAFYLLVVVLIKWLLHPSLDALWFFIGGAVGVYFLEAAELFFALNPSPFRSVVFTALFAVVSFFVVTSSSGTLGSGLVLSLFLQMLLWQYGELRLIGNLDRWYRMVAGQVPVSAQRWWLAGMAAVFVVETVIFIR